MSVSSSNTPEQLFCNLCLHDQRLQAKPGNVLVSTTLLAGTTVGAGVLALPAVTLPSGVLPSTVLMIGVWLYTLISGLLIAEVSVNAMAQEGRASNGFLIMVEQTLGGMAAKIAGIAYLFLHYALLVAYVAQGGEILVTGIEKFLGVEEVVPRWTGTAMFTLLFGGIIYWGRERFVEKLNSAFVGIVVVSFLGLLWLSTTQVNVESFLFQDWSALQKAISVMLVALFYHNIIPVVTQQLEGDVRKIRKSIFFGSIIPLIMFLAWNAAILGSVNPGIVSADSTFDPLQILRAGGSGELLGVLVSVFSEFAIATSFIGFVYGLLNLFQDINLFSTPSTNRLPLISLILFPPMSLGSLNPTIFFTALDYAGTFSISILGGIIPALMTWKQRETYSSVRSHNLVPGGHLTLTIIMGIAIALMIRQIRPMF